MVTPEVLNNVLEKYDKQVGIEHILLKAWVHKQQNPAFSTGDT